MTKQSSPPNVPEIEQCPRCGNNILIGDKRCSRCGYDLMSIEDKLRAQNPNFVALVSFVIGVALALAATGVDGFMQGAFLIVGTLIIVGGWGFLVASYIFTDDKRPRN